MKAALLFTLVIALFWSNYVSADSCTGNSAFCNCLFSASVTSCSAWNTQCEQCCAGGTASFSCNLSFFQFVSDALFGTDGLQCSCETSSSPTYSSTPSAPSTDYNPPSDSYYSPPSDSYYNPPSDTYPSRPQQTLQHYYSRAPDLAPAPGPGASSSSTSSYPQGITVTAVMSVLTLAIVCALHLNIIH